MIRDTPLPGARQEAYAAFKDFLETFWVLEEHNQAVREAYKIIPVHMTEGMNIRRLALEDAMDMFAFLTQGMPYGSFDLTGFAEPYILARRFDTGDETYEPSPNEVMEALNRRACRIDGPPAPKTINLLYLACDAQTRQTLKNTWADMYRTHAGLLSGLDANIAVNRHWALSRATGEMAKKFEARLAAGSEDAAAEEEEPDEIAALEEQLEAANMPEDAAAEAARTLRLLKKMPPTSSEYGIQFRYLETLADMPWREDSEDCTNIVEAGRTLEASHLGLQAVKDAVIEQVALRAAGVETPQILCLVGPPGTGKTSIGQSIAQAMRREFQRVALGGVHSESEIRGHRRTYIGAMPGKLVEALRNAGFNNPVIMLDEIDKLGDGPNGSPEAALLEALDPEQNKAFQDHYLGVPFDLSRVFFIATANDAAAISAPLRDRMRIVRLEGYSLAEKLAIGRKMWAGIAAERKLAGISIGDAALERIVRGYTREAGVRLLEQRLRDIGNKLLVNTQRGIAAPSAIEPETVSSLLGPAQVEPERIPETDQVGYVNGLAWTERGGCLLPIEAIATDSTRPGNKATGRLGETMRESADVAFSLIRTIALECGMTAEETERKSIHMHALDGAVPKDGPSAGVTFVTAAISALTGIAVRRDVAMTGEVGLRGSAGRIGGLREKLEAARDGGVRTVYIPRDNARDLAAIPDSVKNALEIVPVGNVREILETALVQSPFAPAAMEASPRRSGQRAEPEPGIVLNRHP